MADVQDLTAGRMVEHVSGAVGEVIVAGRNTRTGRPGVPVVFVDWIDGSDLSDAQPPQDLTLLPTYLELLRELRRARTDG